ncbi:MAG: hypothetical protein KatS3mg102_1796 [Planctomycetota bacterium]|nr:MAG: hypothetical protein KatS3mg102_1796 [Planctomycetota bacterium]
MGGSKSGLGRRRLGLVAGLALVLCLAAGLIPPPVRAELDRRSYAELLQQLDQAVREGADAQAAELLRQLAADDSARAVRVLVKVAAVLPESESIYDAVQEFVRRITDSQARRELRRQALKGQPWQLRVMLLDALGQHRGGEELETLAEATRDRDQRVALAAVRQLASLKTRAAVEALIAAMERYDKRPHERDVLWQDLRNALARLLGVELDMGLDYRGYFEARREQFVDGRGLPGAGAARPRRAAEEGASVTLFGQPIHCRRVVLILDVSGSMDICDPYPEGSGPATRAREGGEPERYDYTKDPERKRIARAKKELVRTLEQLAAAGAQVNICAYSTFTQWWKPEGLHRLTPQELASAKAFVDSFVAEGVTATDTALLEAFRVAPEADCFYLISDGFATHDGTTKVPTAEILRAVAEANRLRKVQINTLGFLPNPDVVNDGADPELMGALAEQTGGTYTQIR